jgi:kinesin family protein C2/C3
MAAQLSSLSNLTNLLQAAASSPESNPSSLEATKISAVAFSSVLDDTVYNQLGPSPGHAGHDRSRPATDMVGGNDNACVSLVLALCKAVETTIKADVTAAFSKAEAEAAAWKDQFERSERERLKLLDQMQKMQSSAQATSEAPVFYDGSLVLASNDSKQKYAISDDAALIELGIQPPVAGESRAMVTTTYRPSMQELTTVRSQRDFLAQELTEVKAQLHKRSSEVTSRECDMSSLAHQLDSVTAAHNALMKTNVTLKKSLYDANANATKLANRCRLHEKAAVEAKELGALAVTKAEVIMDRAKRIKASRMKPLIRAKKAAYKARTEYSSVSDFVKKEIRNCLYDVCDVMRDGLFKLGGELKGAAEMRVKYRREADERRLEFDKMLMKQGRIRVMARVRPLHSSARSAGDAPCLSVDEGNTLGIDADDVFAYQHKKRRFRYDRVFNADNTEQQVAAEVVPLAMSAMDGYNVCIFAYGQTGSGKTHTMTALTSVICRKIFNSRDGFKSAVSVSYVEIYNNEVRDLLRNPKSEREKEWGATFNRIPTVDVRVSGSDGKVEVDCLEVMVTCAEEVEDLVRRGTAMRSTFATDANAHSSRSHSLLTLNCVVENEWAGLKYKGKLNLVDLAGSERLGRTNVVGERLKETQFINSSLSALGNVLSSLVKEQMYVPYRDSKLTMLLSDSLAGGSKVLMMLCVKEGLTDKQETLQTLQFGARGKKVRMASAARKVEDVEEDVEEDGEAEEEQEDKMMEVTQKVSNAKLSSKAAASERARPPVDTSAGPPTIRGRGKK